MKEDEEHDEHYKCVSNIQRPLSAPIFLSSSNLTNDTSEFTTSQTTLFDEDETSSKSDFFKESAEKNKSSKPGSLHGSINGKTQHVSFVEELERKEDVRLSWTSDVFERLSSLHTLSTKAKKKITKRESGEVEK